MYRVAHLIEASGKLRRQIWASLPFHLRFAEFCTRLAVSTSDAFGKAVYGEFLTHGITEGMPKIRGKPASEFDITRKPVANYLPHGYGRNFGGLAYSTLMKKFHNPHLIEEVMSDFLVRFLSGGSKKIRPGSTRRQAEQYVLTSLSNEALNAIRKKKEVSDVYISDEGGERRHELPVFDEDTVGKYVKRMLPKIRNQLKAIHQDAPLYVKLWLVDGYTDREIIGDGTKALIPHPYSRQGKPLNESSWSVIYKPKIRDVLKEGFEELRLSV